MSDNQGPSYGRSSDLDAKLYLLTEVLDSYWVVVQDPTSEFLPYAMFVGLQDAIDYSGELRAKMGEKFDVMALDEWREQYIDEPNRS